MKFHLLNGLVLLAAVLVVSTLGEPLLTESVRTPLQVMAVALAGVNSCWSACSVPSRARVPPCWSTR